jgi:hypothetical protein
MMGGFDMLDDGLDGLTGAMILDAYTEGPSMETTGYDYSNHFARSPEWFYDMNSFTATSNWGNGFAGI